MKEKLRSKGRHITYRKESPNILSDQKIVYTNLKKNTFEL